jgi:hypothetical protein
MCPAGLKEKRVKDLTVEEFKPQLSSRRYFNYAEIYSHRLC